MIMIAQNALAPFSDRRGRFSALKTVTAFGLVAPALWMAYEVSIGAWDRPSPSVNLLIQTGYWAIWFLLLSLAVTPFRRIFRRSGLIAVRRMVGLAGLAYTLAHLVSYAAVKLWDLGVILRDLSTPLILVGWLSLFGLIALGVTSFDAAIRRMGSRAWNRLHYLVYPVTALAILHFLLSPATIAGVAFTFSGLFFWLMAWRLLNRYRLAERPVALFGLALGAALFTALFEALWLWAYQGTRAPGGGSPLATLALNVDPEWWGIVGLSPTWKVLLAGLGVALAAALWQRTGLYARGREAGPPRAWTGRLVLTLGGAALGAFAGLALNPPPAPDPLAGLDFGDSIFLAPVGPAVPAETDWARIAGIAAAGAIGAAGGFGLGVLADRRTRRILAPTLMPTPAPDGRAG